MMTHTQTRRLVVAWYRENLDWLAELPNGIKATVYYKGGNGVPECLIPFEYDPEQFEIVPLPNLGREADTYLQHICARYDDDDLEDVTYFIQGDPAPHMPDVNYNRSQVCARIASLGDREGPLLTSYMTESKPPAFHERVNVRCAARFLMGNAGVLPTYTFAAGAQYAVSRDAIRSRPLEFWQRARKAVLDDEVNAWEIERLWPLLFWHTLEDY
jgi:hypothetical protein